MADDLTGACDAAVAFADRGLRTRVVLTGMSKDDESAEVYALSTGSRDLPVEEAIQRLSELAASPEIVGFQCLFKKVDSVFRGNTAHEIAAAVRLFGTDLAVVAPAYPVLGRISLNGVIHVRDLDGERHVQAVEALRSAGLEPDFVAARGSPEILEAEMLKTAHRNRNGVVYCDAVDEADLEEVVQAAGRLRLRVLWIGSGGLAHAVAATRPMHAAPAASSTVGTVLIFAGSDHPVSLHQLHHLRERGDIVCWSPGSLRPEGVASTGAVVIPVDCGSTAEREIADLARRFDPHDVSCLFMTGGDTAALVCRALGIESLDLQTEFAPGLPQCAAAGGPFGGRTVVLKSGGFGDADTISRIVDQFARRERCVLE